MLSFYLFNVNLNSGKLFKGLFLSEYWDFFLYYHCIFVFSSRKMKVGSGNQISFRSFKDLFVKYSFKDILTYILIKNKTLRWDGRFASTCALVHFKCSIRTTIITMTWHWRGGGSIMGFLFLQNVFYKINRNHDL